MKNIRLQVDHIDRYRQLAAIPSQAELARRAGWTPQYLNAVIRRRVGHSITLDKLSGLANALGVHPSLLISYE